MQLNPRSLRKPRLVLLALLLVLTSAQLGPLATSASAAEHIIYLCYPEWSEKREKAGDAVVVWICRKSDSFWFSQVTPTTIYDWEFSHIEPANNDKTVKAKRYSDSPPYKMYIQSSFGVGTGGGVGVGTIRITWPDGTALNRRIAVRTITEVMQSGSSFFYNCRDTGWVEAPTARSWWNSKVAQWSQPDCGAGTYRSQVAGRFWSVSLGRWITSNWHYSGGIWLSGPAALTEPTVTPTPHVESPE